MSRNVLEPCLEVRETTRLARREVEEHGCSEVEGRGTVPIRCLFPRLCALCRCLVPFLQHISYTQCIRTALAATDLRSQSLWHAHPNPTWGQTLKGSHSSLCLCPHQSQLFYSPRVPHGREVFGGDVFQGPCFSEENGDSLWFALSISGCVSSCHRAPGDEEAQVENLITTNGNRHKGCWERVFPWFLGVLD